MITNDCLGFLLKSNIKGYRQKDNHEPDQYFSNEPDTSLAIDAVDQLLNSITALIIRVLPSQFLDQRDDSVLSLHTRLVLKMLDRLALRPDVGHRFDADLQVHPRVLRRHALV